MWVFCLFVCFRKQVVVCLYYKLFRRAWDLRLSVWFVQCHICATLKQVIIMIIKTGSHRECSKTSGKSDRLTNTMSYGKGSHIFRAAPSGVIREREQNNASPPEAQTRKGTRNSVSACFWRRMETWQWPLKLVSSLFHQFWLITEH